MALVIALLVIAVVAGLLGFGGLAIEASGTARILFFVFLAAAAISLLARSRP